MLQAYISNDNQHIKRFDKQKLISAAVLLGNAALSLEWVECRREICLFGAFSIKCSKTLYFLNERRGAIAFGFKEGKVIRGGAHLIKCNRVLCFFERDPRRSFLPLFLLLFSSK